MIFFIYSQKRFRHCRHTTLSGKAEETCTRCRGQGHVFVHWLVHWWAEGSLGMRGGASCLSASTQPAAFFLTWRRWQSSHIVLLFWSQVSYSVRQTLKSRVLVPIRAPQGREALALPPDSLQSEASRSWEVFQNLLKVLVTTLRPGRRKRMGQDEGGVKRLHTTNFSRGNDMQISKELARKKQTLRCW